jgi:uncharacterized protein YigA (DUF484 family)
VATSAADATAAVASVHAVVDRLSAALEQEAERVATLELHRRRALLASLGSAEREAITRIAKRVAEAIAADLVSAAKSDYRLFHTLHAMYLSRTPSRLTPRSSAASASGTAE